MNKDSASEYDGFRQAINSLPSGQREALILVDQSGFSYEEAAEICGCSVRAFKNRLDHARNQLSKINSAHVVDVHIHMRDSGPQLKIVLTRKADDQNPPGLAEFLLMLFATKRRAEYVTGDLNERFATECEKLGRDRAVRLYWARTLRSLRPLLWRAMGKAVKWGAVIAAVRRLF